MRNKNINSIFLLIALFVCGMLHAQSQGNGPIVVDTTPVISACNVGGGTATTKVPTEALTGDNIPLAITTPLLPPGSANCVINVKITNTPNLTFAYSGAIGFSPSGANTYTNTTPITPLGSNLFFVYYKFPAGVTCDGTVGTFTVTYEITCGTTVTTCINTVSVRARAGNYWTVSKAFITGNLSCGESYWEINLSHNNPNGYGLGCYNIAGTITETSPDVISPIAPVAVNASYLTTGRIRVITSVLQNCRDAGATITTAQTIT